MFVKKSILYYFLLPPIAFTGDFKPFRHSGKYDSVLCMMLPDKINSVFISVSFSEGISEAYFRPIVPIMTNLYGKPIIFSFDFNILRRLL